MTIYYDKTSIAAVGNDLKDILSFSAGVLTIDDAIRTHKKVYTYQLWYSCSDSFNPSSSVDTPFRIVIFNSNYSPLASGSQAYLDMFYLDTSFTFTIDTSKFNTTGLTYTIVGTLNDDPIKDGANSLTTSVDATSKLVTFGNFATTTLA